MNIEQAREVASKALQSLSDSLAQGESEALRNYLAAMGKFHRYSASNILLIMTKRPDATHVAGYQTWRKLHRQVTRGTKGIVIFRRSCAGPWMRMNVGLRASGKASLAIARPWSSMLPTPREIRVLTHELAHERLHFSARRAETTKCIRETEAEAVAFVVGEAIGLETKSASCDYVKLYNGDRDTPAQSLQHIQQVSTDILSGITPP
ncbi:MAG: ArdC-like ssDNA-binding domain-containing protein [Candidatus Acidiferrales bacterium]|jgi:hypothetical protein